jgi:hypothetical protein
LYPDAAGLAGQRRSRAARRALQALQGANRLPPDEQAARVAAVVADYLRRRCDATAEEMSPSEAANCLEHVGCSSDLTKKGVEFFKDCDAARFGPDGTPSDDDLPTAARRFILNVEAETWAASHSS